MLPKLSRLHGSERGGCYGRQHEAATPIDEYPPAAVAALIEGGGEGRGFGGEEVRERNCRPRSSAPPPLSKCTANWAEVMYSAFW